MHPESLRILRAAWHDCGVTVSVRLLASRLGMTEWAAGVCAAELIARGSVTRGGSATSIVVTRSGMSDAAWYGRRG